MLGKRLTLSCLPFYFMNVLFLSHGGGFRTLSRGAKCEHGDTISTYARGIKGEKGGYGKEMGE